MKNPRFLKIGWQSDLGIDTARSQWRVNDMLIVRGQNYDWLLIRFANANLAVIFIEARNRSVAVSEQLIKECLTNLRQFFELIELDDRRDAADCQEVISFQYLAQNQKSPTPLLTSGFTKCPSAALDRLDNKVILSLLIPLKEDVSEAETIHSLQLEVWQVARVGERVDHLSLAPTALAFGQQRHP